MKRVFKKTIAAAMAGIMMFTGLPQTFADTVQTETQSDVEFIYDDGGKNGEGLLFMEGGKFNSEVDEDAVLVLMDKNGNKTEIPSQSQDGKRNFTKVVTSVSGSNYSMVSLENENGTAFVKMDGTYFGGDGKYYPYEYIYPISEHVLQARYTIEEDGNFKSYVTLFTDTGKEITFDTTGSTYVSTRMIGDKLLCYSRTYNAEEKNYDYEIYAYDAEKDEINQIEGQFAFVADTHQYFAVKEHEGDSLSVYDSSLQKTEITIPNLSKYSYISASYLDTDGYLYLSGEDGYSDNIMNINGELWNTTDKTLKELTVVDAENGYYYANVLNDENEYEIHILSKDNAVDVNVLSEIQKLTQKDEVSVNVYGGQDRWLTTTVYSFNGDVIVWAKDLESDNEGSAYIFDSKSNYTDIKKLDDADYIYVSESNILTASKETDTDASDEKLIVQNVYDNQYQKIELQTTEKLEIDYAFSRRYFSATKNSNVCSFILINRIAINIYGLYTYDYACRMITKDGFVSASYKDISSDSLGRLYCTYYEDSNKMDVYDSEGNLLCSGNKSGETNVYDSTVYDSEGNLIYSGQDNPRRDYYLDDSVCVFQNQGSEYAVSSYDGIVYFSNDDYYLSAYNVTENGKFMACVYQTDSDGNTKYGAKIISDLKRQLCSDSNVKLEFVNGQQLEGDVTLDVEMYTAPISLDGIIKDTFIKPEDVTYAAYAIRLLNEEQQEIQPDGEVTVKIPCPTGYDGTKCKVYYVDENGKMQDMNATYEAGYLSFQTTHFSTYLVTETELKTMADALYGDVNGDGTITLTDSALIRRHLAGWTVTLDLTAADVNGDEMVTLTDSALIRRYLAGWDVTLQKKEA